MAGPEEKKILSLIVEKEEKHIGQRGELRNIDVYGDGGAVFTLTFKDSSDCTILKKEIENVKIPRSGNYSFKQKFPPLKSGTQEVYSLVITAAAGSSLGGFIFGEKPQITLYQYKDPTISFTYTSSTAHDPIFGNTLGVSGGDVACVGVAGSSAYSSKVSTTNLTSGSANAIYTYGKPSFSECISSSSAIKKIVQRDGDDTSRSSTVKLKPASQVSDGTTVASTYTDELKAGMSFSGKVSYEKTVSNSLDEDGKAINDSSCSELTNRFRLSNNKKLFEGMSVWKDNTFISEIKTIGEGEGCDPLTDITLASEHIIRDDTVLRFEWLVGGGIAAVPSGATVNRKTPSNFIFSGCEDEIILVGAAYIPDGTELTFDDNETVIHGSITVENSGFAGVSPTTTNGTMSVVTRIEVEQFGTKDVTYTIDLDKFITKVPNAYDQEVIAPINTTTSPTSTTIYPKAYDTDANAATKTCSVFTNPRHGTVSAYDADLHTIVYTPYTNFVGEDSFGFRTNDGTNPSNEKTIYITVK